MTTEQSSSGQGSSRNRAVPKVNLKDMGLASKKSLGNNFNSNFSFNSLPFEMPTVSTNGMKNIEHFIDKTLIDGKQWYRCKWQSCSYSTIRSDSIVRHMRKHTGERPYVCNYNNCNYATIQSSALKIHMRKHTGERPYVCNYLNCGKRFSVLNTLQIHLRTHSGIRPYSCDSCNYSSNDRCKLVSHMRKAHQLEVSSPTNSKLPAASTSSPFSIPNGNSHSLTGSSGHSLALVSGAMSPSQLLSSSLVANYNPFAMHNSSQLSMASALSSSNTNALKSAGSASPLFPLNFLTVISSSENIQNSSNCSSTATTSARSKQVPSALTEWPSEPVTEIEIECQIVPDDVSREENSIQRVMALVDKRLINNRTSYFCKWPDCAYESLRSDSLVRHIRSHTGERPYRCSIPNCTYATIQRSTLNKHLSRHLSNLFNS